MQFNDDSKEKLPVAKELPIWEQPVPTAAPYRTPLTRSLRTKLALTAIVYPVLCLANVIAGGTPSIDPLWQSDTPDVYVTLLLSSPTFLMFLPFIAYSIIGMAVWCLRPATSKLFAIRFALYTGVVVTGMFSCLLAYITLFIGPIAALITIGATALLTWLAPMIVKKAKRFSILGLLVTTTAVAILLVIAINVPEFGGWLIGIPFIGYFCAIASAPFVAFLSFFRASVAAAYLNSMLGDQQQRKLTSIGVIVVWIGTFFMNWKLAIDLMMEEYSKLPLQDPSNCFVCSAAAHGHRRFVAAQLQSGILVNRQMQRLKLLEFALQFLLPNCHRWIRIVYNRIGPPIAKLCRVNHWTADAVYVGLKPVEYAAIGLQKYLGVTNDKLDQVYRLAESQSDD